MLRKPILNPRLADSPLNPFPRNPLFARGCVALNVEFSPSCPIISTAYDFLIIGFFLASNEPALFVLTTEVRHAPVLSGLPSQCTSPAPTLCPARTPAMLKGRLGQFQALTPGNLLFLGMLKPSLRSKNLLAPLKKIPFFLTEENLLGDPLFARFSRDIYLGLTYLEIPLVLDVLFAVFQEIPLTSLFP